MIVDFLNVVLNTGCVPLNGELHYCRVPYCRKKAEFREAYITTDHFFCIKAHN